MTGPEPMKGVLAPVVTPFRDDLSPDADRLVEQCRFLLAADCGLAIFGTNSEGNSLSVAERVDLIDQLIEAGIDPARMMPGTGGCAIPDAVRLTRHVAERGCGGALVLPPFYYKGVSDDGLYRTFAEIIERCGDARTRIYLYHIPPIAQVGFSLPLIERLVRDYPTAVVGMKDSSGDKANARAVCEALPGWAFFAGNETFLTEALGFGAVGTISATCNVNPAGIVGLYKNWQAEDAGTRQARCNEIRGAFGKYFMISAMKAAIAEARGAPSWRKVRPPLSPLTDVERAALMGDLEAIGFDLSSLEARAPQPA
jgi:4-hydroxy-tetrahydrodipicolinate synthase